MLTLNFAYLNNIFLGFSNVVSPLYNLQLVLNAYVSWQLHFEQLKKCIEVSYYY